MEAWNEVRWTEARQITAAMGQDEDPHPAPDVVPQAHYAALRTSGDRAGAVTFLAHALPRYEALAWAARVLEEEAEGQPLKLRHRQALDNVLRWVGEPNDQRRRAAMDAAEAADGGAEKMLAMAVFFSGGSISLPDLPPVPPAPELTGRLAGVAITVAAMRGDRRDDVLDRALDLGEKIAAKGAKILEAA